MAEVKFTNPETGETVTVTDNGFVKSDKDGTIVTTHGNAKEALKWLFKNKKIKTDEDQTIQR